MERAESGEVSDSGSAMLGDSSSGTFFSSRVPSTSSRVTMRAMDWTGMVVYAGALRPQRAYAYA